MSVERKELGGGGPREAEAEEENVRRRSHWGPGFRVPCGPSSPLCPLRDPLPPHSKETEPLAQES